jgi:dCMP deaminase
MKPEIKKAYMKVAETFSNVSNCKRMKVGAIVVKNESILAHGWNGTPSGFHTNCCELPDGSTNPFVLHAEQNALIKMAKSSESTVGSELFCTHSPCPDCSKMIAQAGIKKVYYKHEYRISDGINVLKELGVEVEKL